MIKKWRWSMTVLLSLLVFSIITVIKPVRVAAAETNRVLLVYDSKNTVAHGEKKIDALQRILTSMNLSVKTVKASNYHAGELNATYTGVITMVNWRQAGLKNTQFETDRAHFTGIKLHIGDCLTGTEAKDLQGKIKVLNEQQLILKNGNDQQLLPFSDHLEVLDQLPANAIKVGQLTSQQTDQKTYDYGVIVGKNAYLPYLKTRGLSLLVAEQTITQLFGQTQQYQPLLTFTDVSPYANLKVLDQLSEYCYKRKIPFAISTTTVADNTDLQAFAQFTAFLRRIEKRNGVIFVQTPVIGGATQSDGQKLSEMFTSYLVSFSRYQVYPVGISAPGYWNQDQVLRRNSLAKANHWLLLPNTDVTYLKQDNKSQVANQSFMAVSAASLTTIQNQSQIKFNVPTAVTVSVPSSMKKIHIVEREISGLGFQWFNFSQSKTSTEIKSGTTTVNYRQGKYYVNGSEEPITMSDQAHTKEPVQPKTKVLFKSFFKTQGQIIGVFFSIVFIVLLIFILIGRRIYRNMFKR